MLQTAIRGGLARDDFPRVENRRNQSHSQQRIYEHLKILFDLSGLSRKEREVLRYATLLPEGGMDFGLFTACVPKKIGLLGRFFPGRLESAAVDAPDVAGRLVDLGWIQGEGDLLSIHPVIREVCWEELKPTDQNCGVFLRMLSKYFDPRVKYDARLFEQMAKCFSIAADRLPDSMGGCAFEASNFWNQVGRFTLALQYGLLALERTRRIVPRADEEIAICCNNLGYSYGRIGDPEKALEYKLEALEIMEHILPPGHLRLAIVYNNLGISYGELGDDEKALECKMKALEIRGKVLPPNHPDLVTSYSNLGSYYNGQGDYERSLEYYIKALEISEKIYPLNHPSLAAVYNNVGSLYGNMGHLDQALEYQMKAVEISENALIPEHPFLAQTYNSVANMFFDIGEYQKSADYARKAVEIWENLDPRDGLDVAEACVSLGKALGELGEFREAMQYLEQTLAILLEHFSEDSDPVQDIRVRMEEIRSRMH